ncbi:hypothetical protein [Micrococcus endophyticus]|uniref:hypothetical protein n=1 Tax=Micrococcus endophyticus TaxID=455343 RepID=UPI001607F8D7|nr:hypothetical protein [Micrococcus endophyticus]
MSPEKYSIEDLTRWKKVRENIYFSSAGIIPSGDSQAQILERESRNALESLGNFSSDALDDFIDVMGNFIRSLPDDPDFERAAVREIAEMKWSPDAAWWARKRDAVLFFIRQSRVVSTEIESVLSKFFASKGFPKSANALAASPSLARILESYGLFSAFEEEIVESVRAVIQNRVAALALAQLIFGQGAYIDTKWDTSSLTEGQIRDGMLPRHLFDVVLPDLRFNFRVYATRRTLDVYGLDRGFYFPEDLGVALVDPPAWWVYLVPSACSQLVWSRWRLRNNEGAYKEVLNIVSRLDATKGWQAGAA